MYFPLNIPERRNCMLCLNERRRENIPACSVVMACVVEQGQSASTLGASGSITGARDPEHSVWKDGCEKPLWLRGPLSHAARPTLNQTRPRGPRLQQPAAPHGRRGRRAEVQHLLALDLFPREQQARPGED